MKFTFIGAQKSWRSFSAMIESGSSRGQRSTQRSAITGERGGETLELFVLRFNLADASAAQLSPSHRDFAPR